MVLDLPKGLTSACGEPGADLSQTLLEKLAVAAYRENKVSTRQLRRILGFETQYELDGFLKAQQVWLEYWEQDLARDRRTHEHFGI